MNMTVIGHQMQWDGNTRKVVPMQVNLAASQHVRVWLVDDSDGNNDPFLVILGARTPEDAARGYARHRKEGGHTPPAVFRVFPLTSLQPIALTGVVDPDGDEQWSAFSDAWVEVRL